MPNRFVVKLISSYSGRPCLNVFGYEEGAAGGSSSDLFTTFNSNVVNAIAGILVDAVALQRVEIYNFDLESDFYAGPATPSAGVISGDGLPPFNSWSYEYVRGSRASRNGWKRFPGVPEAWQADGVKSGGHDVALDYVATKCAETLPGTGGATYIPRIFRYVYPKPNPTHAPPTSITAFPVANVIYAHIGSQNSRKL